MIETQDIFNQYGDEYRKNHKLPLHITRTMLSIETCRTAELGGFIRRFLMHVLPRKFAKVRHYGISSNKNRSTKLIKCKKLTGMLQNTKQKAEF